MAVVWVEILVIGKTVYDKFYNGYCRLYNLCNYVEQSLSVKYPSKEYFLIVTNDFALCRIMATTAMSHLKFSPLLLLGALAAVALGVLVSQKPPAIDWRGIHEAHPAALHNLLSQNHPGAIEDAALARWLKIGRVEAEARESRVTDRAAYLASLTAYAQGFRDPHVAIEPAQPLPPPRWPGFIVSLRAGKPTVVDRDAKDAHAPPLGAVIESCDGARVAALVKERVLPYGYDQRVPANRVRAVTALFLDGGNPFAPAPASCVIVPPPSRTGNAPGKSGASALPAEVPGAMQTPNTIATTVKLTYRATPKDFSARHDAAQFGPAAPTGWRQPAPGVVWIGLPSFDYGEANAKALRPVIDRLAADAERVRQGRAIVFDVRGNTGGSSLWAEEIRNILWYPETIAKYGPPDPSAVDWRASPGNRDFMLDLISQVIPKVGSQSAVGLNLTRIARGLSEAVDAKQTFWREGNPTPPKGGGLTQRRPKREPPAFPAKVIILSNGSCASACLDFADRILQMPGTFIVGFATAGDGLYTETRSITLPSGHAVLHFPMKVYRGRPRGDMEYYEPDIAYDGPWTEPALRTWMLDLIDDEKLAPPAE